MMIIAYDGTNYVGWQMQPNGTAIEEVINRELSELLHEQIVVAGASRTDSGVHALGNVAVFDTETRIPAEKICFALNQRLPDDIVIQSSCEVPVDFHPRHAQCTKTYEYRIYNAIHPNPMKRRYSYFVYAPLDINAMREAAKYIIGEHDFASFCSTHAQVKTTVRTIYSLEILTDDDLKPDGTKIIEESEKRVETENREETKNSDELGNREEAEISDELGNRLEAEKRGMLPISKNVSGKSLVKYENCVLSMVKSESRKYQTTDIRIRISGNGFLYNMVRIIVGTLCKVGYHFYPAEHVKEIIEGCDRGLAGPKAPAEGLTLIGIEYPELTVGTDMPRLE